MKSIELSDVAALTPHEPLFVTNNGHTVAAIVPTDDDDVGDMLLSINPEFQTILERSQRRLELEGGLSSEEVWQRLGLPPR